MVRSIFVMVFMLVISACGTNKQRGELPANFETLQRVVRAGQFEIENQWAIPLAGNMIDLTGNSNSITFRNDSINVYLPYFGVRHSGGGYGDRDGGIKFEGPVKDLVITEDAAKETLNLKFEGSNETEHFNFRITLFSNGNTTTYVNSSARNAISYRGTVRKLPEEEVK